MTKVNTSCDDDVAGYPPIDGEEVESNVTSVSECVRRKSEEIIYPFTQSCGRLITPLNCGFTANPLLLETINRNRDTRVVYNNKIGYFIIKVVARL